MFRFDAFGQRVLCSPRLSFMAPKGDPAGGGGGDDSTVELDGEKFAFPAKTAVADMTPEQASEYWRHEAKKQQKKAKGAKPADYDQLAADAAELARIRAEQTPKEQREQQERIDEARRDGENTGAQRYLKDAIFGRIQGITGLDDDAVTAALEPVDPTYFIDAEGNLDAEKITKFSGSLAQGAGGQGTVPDPVRDAVKRQRPAGGGGGGQSMQERREAARDRMTPKSKKTTT